jgi:hypothetical protein
MLCTATDETGVVSRPDTPAHRDDDMIHVETCSSFPHTPPFLTTVSPLAFTQSSNRRHANMATPHPRSWATARLETYFLVSGGYTPKPPFPRGAAAPRTPRSPAVGSTAAVALRRWCDAPRQELGDLLVDTPRHWASGCHLSIYLYILHTVRHPHATSTECRRNTSPGNVIYTSRCLAPARNFERVPLKHCP